MSLLIDVRHITAVLLADGWHNVKPGTFDLDSYEFGVGDNCIHYGGNSGVCATGYEFTDEDGQILSGPLTAILAVRRGNDRAGGRQPVTSRPVKHVPYRNPTDQSLYDEEI